MVMSRLRSATRQEIRTRDLQFHRPKKPSLALLREKKPRGKPMHRKQQSDRRIILIYLAVREEESDVLFARVFIILTCKSRAK